MKYLREIDGYGMVEVDKKTADVLDSWEASRRLLHLAVDRYVNEYQSKVIRKKWLAENAKLHSNGWHIENKETFNTFRRSHNG